jgi:hypothetical protein
LDRLKRLHTLEASAKRTLTRRKNERRTPIQSVLGSSFARPGLRVTRWELFAPNNGHAVKWCTLEVCGDLRFRIIDKPKAHHREGIAAIVSPWMESRYDAVLHLDI